MLAKKRKVKVPARPKNRTKSKTIPKASPRRGVVHVFADQFKKGNQRISVFVADYSRQFRKAKSNLVKWALGQDQ